MKNGLKTATFIIFVLVLFVFTETYTKNNSGKSLVFHGAYAFSSFKGQKASAIYLTLMNTSNKSVIIKSLKSEVGKKLEIHEIINENNITKMKKINNFIIKGNETIFFQPGGTHIMVFGLNKELEDKETFEIDIQTDDLKKYKINVMVLDKKLRTLQ